MKISAIAETHDRSAGRQITRHFQAFAGGILLLSAFLAATAAWSAETSSEPELVSPWPLSLGVPDGCGDSSPKTLNNGAIGAGLLIGSASNCGISQYLPFTWQNGAWRSVPLPESPKNWGGWVDSISDAGAGEPVLTLTVMLNNHNEAFVKMPGQPPTGLPALAGSTGIEKAVVSADGHYIVGGTSGSASSAKAVRWARNGAGWSAPEYLAPGRAVATSADGSVVVGNEQSVELFFDGSPWVWTASPGGGGAVVKLESDTMVFDVAGTGSIIVGSRPAVKPDCTCACSCAFPVPVYWVPGGGGWVMHDLQAIDGVDSIAKAVAEVDGRAVIVGMGYTDDGQGGILRPVAWIPAGDGSYGAPLRLEPLGGAFESWAEAVDINRNGVILGWSDASSTDWTTTAVVWRLPGQLPFEINVGHSGAWFNPNTAGQGQFIDVEPQSRFVFVSWFTYTPPGTDHPGQQHWLTAQGYYQGDSAELTVYETLGGRFDDPQAVSTNPVGEATLQFFDCGLGAMTYRLDHWNVEGEFPLQRVIPDSSGVCEARRNVMQATDVNAGMDGAWFEPDTEGQGLFIDVQPNPSGDSFIFVSWFTYGDETASGQRWLTAQGSFDGSLAQMDVNETTGGSFDAAGATETTKVGTMSIDFSDCSNALMTYTLTGEGLAGEVGLTRVLPASQALCEELSGTQ